MNEQTPGSPPPSEPPTTGESAPQPAARPRSGFFRRIMGAATFDIATYEELEHDETATAQAAIVVGMVAVAAAVASLQVGTGGIIAGLVGAYVGWGLWSATCYFVGVQLFEGTADWGELLRTIGFAQAPGILLLLRAVPGIDTIVQLVIFFWMIGTVLVAIRQALDFGTGRALATALAGFVPYVFATAALELLFGITPSVIP